MAEQARGRTQQAAWPSTYGALGVSDGTGIVALEKISKEVEDKHLMIQTFH